MIDPQAAAALVERVFADAEGFTQDMSITLGGGEGEAPMIWIAEGALVTRVPADRVDGVTVLPNDELLRLRVSQLPVNTVLKPGDVFRGLVDGIDRNVITAHRDALGLLWTCVVRRVFA